MLRTTFLSLILFVSLSSSSSLLRKSISRRQSEPTHCQAIEGFDCKCSPYRVTCTTDRVLPQQIKVLQSELQKYPSVELVINGAHEQHVYEYTFEPVKQLFKPDADNLEVRVKFEKFTALHLSASVFNRVFPDQVSANAHKNLALEIYNPEVQPNDNVNLFANLNVDSLELYVLYPFRGTFQQLFNGANIKYLRLSGGDIKSDLSQPFTGNIGRLELAKQASQINVKTFPIYPAHELIINAFYVNDFSSDNPPNYSNLVELRIYSQERVPANAFRQYPDLKTLSISTEKDIDPHALDGLYKLEKLTIKDTKPSLELLNTLPSLKEFEISLEKLGEAEQCQLVEKLANGQVAVQAIPSGRECTCASAYLDTASGRYPCEASNCEQSACPAIRNNYDATAHTFKAPPPIKRADGSDALRQAEPKVYTSPFQISSQDKAKAEQGASQQQQQPGPSYDPENPDGQDQQHHHHHPEDQSQWNSGAEKERYLSDDGVESERSEVPWDYDGWDPYLDLETERFLSQSNDLTELSTIEEEDILISHTHHDPHVPSEEQPKGEQDESETQNEGNQQDGTENNQEGGTGSEDGSQSDSNLFVDGANVNGTDVTPPAKKGLSWLPIIIIIASIAVLLLIGLIVLIIKKRNAGYSQAATSESTTTTKK